MRGFIIFIVVVAGIFFGVGETRGWLVGVPGNTPIFAYKSNGSISGLRRALNVESITFGVEGEVKNGSVTVTATYERPQSFQDQTQRALPERILFEEEFRKGETINLTETVEEGQGIYRVRLSFRKGSGTFTMTLPTSAQM